MAKKIYNGLDLVNNRIVNVASPSLATDATNKQYVDNLVNGQSWKTAVQVTTTTNGTLATAYAAGQVIDGYTLQTGDRILLKNQTAASENGVYAVQASGAPLRTADGATGELTTNSTVRINNGTVNADSAWTLTTTGTITVGSTAQVWVRSDSGTPYSAGNGLTLSSNTFSVNAGSGIIADGTSTRIDPTLIARKFSTNIGNGSSTSLSVTHGLGSTVVTYSIYDASSKAFVDTDAVVTDSNTVTFTFAAAPATNAFTVVIMG
jgi:hypothetical protein